MTPDPEYPMRRHLTRLRTFVNQRDRYYYITLCANNRRRILLEQELSSVIEESLLMSLKNHGWAIGQYVLMPDHLHFLCCNAMDKKSLSEFIRDFKRWTSSAVKKLGYGVPLWQREFFDHMIRNNKSYSEKAEYIRMNPVRAGLCESPDAWNYSGRLHLAIDGKESERFEAD